MKSEILNIQKAIQNGERNELTINFKGTKYDAILQPKTKNGTMFLLLVPKEMKNGQIVMETNNCESENFSDEFLGNVIRVSDKLLHITKNNNCPIFVPIIPNANGGVPYLQQLSKECLTLNNSDENYRIDEQVVASLNSAKQIIKEKTGKNPQDKVFLNGYSASGCFAQRFCLLHPELVKTCVLGGSSGSVPVPIKDIKYPIGVKDFKELTGKEFLIDEYKKIDFHYYVAEKETQNKSDVRVDDFGNPAPMHDMSYMERSIPKDVGKEQRKIFGKDLFERADNSIDKLKEMGISVEQKIILGVTHQGIGNAVVNEPQKIFDKQFEKTMSF